MLSVAVEHSEPNTKYWFGLYKTDDVDDASTYWLDGNPSGYRWWANGEPNNNVFCISYRDDGFRDDKCNKDYRYTCKKDSSKQQTRCSFYYSFRLYNVRFQLVNAYAINFDINFTCVFRKW